MLRCQICLVVSFPSNAVFYAFALEPCLSWNLTVDIILTGSGSDGKNKYPHVKTYVSPWEKAMKGDQELIATLKASMPGPISNKDIPNWKSFNRFF